VLLIILAFIAGTEDAIFAIIPAKIKELKRNPDKKNELIIKLLETPQNLKATFWILKNILYIGIFIFIGLLFGGILKPISFTTWHFLFGIAIIVVFVFLFKEAMPQLLFSKSKFSFARSMVSIIAVFHKFFRPLSNFIVNSTSIITKKLLKRRKITLDELSEALNLSSQEIKGDENILKGIIKFGNIDAKEIMKSRIDVFAVDINTEFNDLLDIIIKSGHSRIPVYEESFDDVKGVLYIKDLLPFMKDGNDFKWQDLIRPPYFVPETKKINGLLKEFQANKIHLAIVIDEYGGTYGIVTMEDILEEIVGEITDESDIDEAYYSKINQNTYIFEGKTLLNDFYKIMNINDDFFSEMKGDADTIAGIILELKGEIPRKHELITYKNLTFKVESADKRRIKKVKVIID
jgi:gliding motility-associated protein GldE